MLRRLQAGGVWFWGWLAFSLAMLLIQLVFLVRFPAHSADESWLANASWTWITTSVNVDSMHLETIPEEAVGRTRFFLGQLPWAAMFRAGGLGFFQARLVSWLVGVLLVVSVFVAAAQLYDRATGALAVALLVVSPSFLEATHQARQDGFLALVGLLAFVIAVEAFRRGIPALHGVAGLVAGLTVEIHENGIVFVFALIVLYLVVLGREFHRRPATRWALAGGSVAFLIFSYLHLWPDPSVYLQTKEYHLSLGHTVPISTLSPLRLAKSLLLERQRFSLHSDSVGFVLMVVAASFLSVRRNSADRRLLGYLGGGFLASVLFVGKKATGYAILSTPLIFVAVAAMFLTAFRQSEKGPAKQVMTILLCVLMALKVLVLVDLVIDNRSYSYETTVSRIDAAIPVKDARVMAVPTWWIGLHHRPFTSTHNLVYGVYDLGLSFDEAVARCAPDVLIVDDELRQNLHDSSTEVEARQPFDLERRDLLGLMRGAVVLDSFTTQGHGLIEVLELRDLNP